MTMIEALDWVQEHAHKSALSDEFWQENEDVIDFLSVYLRINKNQVILLAVMCEMGEPVSWRDISRFLGVSRLKAMKFTPDLDDLRDKRWIIKCSMHSSSTTFQDGFRLMPGVIKAIRYNEPFKPENLDSMTEQAMVDRLTRYIYSDGSQLNISYADKKWWIKNLIQSNKHLQLCHMAMEMEDDFSAILFFLAIADFMKYGNTDSEGLTSTEIRNWINDDIESEVITEELQNETHELFERGLLEHKCEDGMVNTDQYQFTSYARSEILSGLTPRIKRRISMTASDVNLIKAQDIQTKNLYYNPKEEKQLKRLKALLEPNNFIQVQDRLAESGLRRGIACLFYGTPGTGKTETAMQIARNTGRSIMQVDISKIRDKYVGESEKNIKHIFSQYKELCKDCETTPILLFNEADAIIGARFETTSSSVEKMNNSIQNIILQEMENLNGILIATTNLTSELDTAFDRRFLFKVEFQKPGPEVRTMIWQSMLPEVSDNHILAQEFEFSGGQIENVARKYRIEYAISGAKQSVTQLKEFCKEEYIRRGKTSKVGFLNR